MQTIDNQVVPDFTSPLIIQTLLKHFSENWVTEKPTKEDLAHLLVSEQQVESEENDERTATAASPSRSVQLKILPN